jgi:hypothetical protein
MSKRLVRFLYGVAISALFMTTSVGVTQAASSDYRFEVVKPPETSGRGSSVTIALVHAPTGRRVADADVFRRETVFREKGPVRVDERRTPLVPDGKGNYRLVTSYPLSSGATLQLGALVPSESGVVRRSVRVDGSH